MPLDHEPKQQASNECFYWREDGTKGDDWIWEEMLDNPEAEEAVRLSVIRDAMIERGMTREQAERLFGRTNQASASSASR